MRFTLLAMTTACLFAAAAPAPFDPTLDVEVLRAAGTGNLAGLGAALDRGGNPNAKDPKGISAFQWAVRRNQPQAVSLLLASGATGLNDLIDVAGDGKTWISPLAWAAWGKRDALAQVLLQAGADPRILDSQGLDALAGAIAAEAPGIAAALLKAGHDPNRRWRPGYTPVWMAAVRGNSEILKQLLDHKGRADSRDDQGTSALMAAASMGHEGAVQLLLERGAPTWPLDAWGRSALTYARSAKDASAGQRIAERLKQAGAQEGEPLRTLDSAFLHAVADGDLGKAKALLAQGADLHARGKFSVTGGAPSDALTAAGRNTQVLKFLLDAGINPHMRSSYDFTALHGAARDGTPEMIGLLVAAGLDPNARSKPGMVPLYMALNGRTNLPNVEALLKLGANPNALTPSGISLFAFVEKKGDRAALQLLKAAGAKPLPSDAAAAQSTTHIEPGPRPGPGTARPHPAAPERIDGLVLDGLRLGMGEMELAARFGALDFKAKGGLRVAKSALSPAVEPFPALKGATDLTLELTLVKGRLVRATLEFAAPSRAAVEASLLELLQGPVADEAQTYTQGARKTVRRDLTWLGNSAYVTYRSFTRVNSPRSTLMLSVLPRQESRPSYDDVKANLPAKADFYIAQGGAFVPCSRRDGKLVFQLKRGPFQIGGNHEGIKVALAEHPIGEFCLDLDPTSNDPISCLSGAFCGAVSEAMDHLFVADGRLGCRGIACLSPEYYRTGKPMPGYAVGYEVNALLRLEGDDDPLPLKEFSGVLYGFLSVTTDRTRPDGQHLALTTPIELVFR